MTHIKKTLNEDGTVTVTDLEEENKAQLDSMSESERQRFDEFQKWLIETLNREFYSERKRKLLGTLPANFVDTDPDGDN